MVGRVARRLGWGRNDMRRTSDRVEGLLLLMLAVASLVGAPLVAWSAGQDSYRDERRTQEWERRYVVATPAVLIEDARTAEAPSDTHVVVPSLARAVWTAPDGSSRSGLVPAAATDRAGTRTTVWMDQDGRLRQQPGRRSPITRAVMVGVAVQLALTAGLAGLHKTGRALLDRRRYRAWQEEWIYFGSRWRRDRR